MASCSLLGRVVGSVPFVAGTDLEEEEEEEEGEDLVFVDILLTLVFQYTPEHVGWF